MKRSLPLIIMAIVIAGFIGAYLYIPKTYAIYQQAIGIAKNDPMVRSALGGNISDSMFAYSKISHGFANIEVTLYGDKGEGLLEIRGVKKDGTWQLKNVFFSQGPAFKRRAIFTSDPRPIH